MTKEEYIEIEADEPAAPTDNALKTISNLLALVPVYEKRVADAEEALAQAQKTLLTLTDETLPNAMDSAGYTAPTKCMIAGKEVKFDTFIAASISEDQRAAAHAWFIKNGHGDLIKRTTQFVFGKGNAELHEAFMAAAEKLFKKFKKVEVKSTDKEAINAQTLKAWVKNELADGREPPADKITLFVGKRVSVKEPVATSGI